MRRIKKKPAKTHKGLVEVFSPRGLTSGQEVAFQQWERYVKAVGEIEESAQEVSLFLTLDPSNTARPESQRRLIYVGFPPSQVDTANPELVGLSVFVGLDEQGRWNTDFITDELWSFGGSEYRQEAACLVMALAMAPLMPLREDAWPNWCALLVKLGAKDRHFILIKSLCKIFEEVYFDAMKNHVMGIFEQYKTKIAEA